MNIRLNVLFHRAPAMGWQGNARTLMDAEHIALADARSLGWRERLKGYEYIGPDGRQITASEAERLFQKVAA